MGDVLRVGLWCAVSSQAQAAEDKISLLDQERAGREFAAAQGGQVVAVYSVPGHTRHIWRWDEAEQEMPAYAHLRVDVEAERLDVLHCVDVDRLGRDPALAQAVISLCERYSVEVYSAANPHELGQRSTGHRYVEAIQMVRAGEDIQRMRYRHRMGMVNRVRRGLMPCTPPAGYRPVRNRSGEVVGAEFDEHADTIRAATRLYLEGWTYMEIARRLEADGYKTPSGVAWYAGLISRWMNRDAYAGLPVWGEVVPNAPSGAYPALWDTETYQAILREREARKRTPHGRKRTSTPLLGIALCRRCGRNMYLCYADSTYADETRTTRKRIRTLRCSTYQRSAKTTSRALECHFNGIRESVVMRFVATALAQLVDQDALAERLRTPTDIGTAEQVAQVEARMAEVRKERERLAEALAAGAMELDIYQAVDEPKRALALSLESRLEELRREQAQVVPAEVRWQSVEELRELVEVGWSRVEPQRLNALLRQIGLRVWIENKEVVGMEIV